MSQMETVADSMPKKDERLQLPALGEWYEDLLTVDAWINNRSKPVQGSSLLCAKLQEREERIKERVAYLAQKRRIDPQEMWRQILTGKSQKISPEEFKQISEDEQTNL